MRAETRSSVTVVVCTYSQERWEGLCEALGSLERQTRPPDEVLVLVDHNEPLRERAAAAFSRATVLASAAPDRGLSGVRNTATALARSSIVAFLDDDAVAEPTWLEELLRVFADPHVMVAGSQITARWAAGRPRWFPEEYGWVVGCSYRGQSRSSAPSRVRNVIGNGMALRHAAMDAGPFRTDLGRVGGKPVGCEETEWCIRVTRHFPGARVVQVPAAKLLHHVPAERARFGHFVRHCYTEGLSKAAVAASVGPLAALSAERRYVVTTLLTGVLRRIVRCIRGEGWALVEAGAIVVGLGATTAGYLVGRRGWGRA